MSLTLQAMLSLSLYSLPHPQFLPPRKLFEAYPSFPAYASTSASASAVKPIVVYGDPPTFVTAPGRRIVAG